VGRCFFEFTSLLSQRFLTRVATDNSTGTWGGYWYADPVIGWLGVTKEWAIPQLDDEAMGLTKALYEVTGNTLRIWNNPVGMDRPTTRESAATHLILARRVDKKESFTFLPIGGLCEMLIDFMF